MEGLLQKFYSTIYYDPNRWVYTILDRLRLPGFNNVLQNIKQRRHHSALDSRLVHQIRWPEAMHQLAYRVLGHRHLTSHVIPNLRNQIFDKTVARSLADQDLDVFHGFSGSCLHSLMQAKEMGKVTIIDQPDVHYATCAKLLEEELAMNPEFESTIPYWPPYQTYLERLEQENQIADYHLVPSTFALESYVSHGVIRERIILLPYGVDVSRFTPQGDRKDDDAEFRILFVGAIGQRKGIKYLLEAMKRLKAPGTRLIMAGTILGNPDVLRQYDGLFQHAGYLNRDRLIELFHRCDVLVLPSVYDAFPLTVLQGMAAELPVIVSDHTGSKDAIRDGVDGYVVPVRDVEALVEKLELLYENRELCRELGRSARERVKEFTWKKYQTRLAQAIVQASGCPS